MRIVETAVFTRRITALLCDESYRALQLTLVLRPEQGKVIPGSGGLRKLRWAEAGKGKRGGLRVIYYFFAAGHRIYMLMVYRKSRQDDLTPEQLKQLRQAMEREFA